ncbi:MAG: signal peptidase I [Ruminococcaceae bacterium]|nr:signal peptidase I [Oscillospiraceae bacterium]
MSGKHEHKNIEPEQVQESTTKRRGEGYLLLHDVVYMVAIVTLVFTFVVRMVGVSGPSMTPTLLDGDYVLVQSNFTYKNVEVGDVVVMLVRSYDDQPIVKRVIATEGQTVNIDFWEGKVYVDGVLLDEPYINNYDLNPYQTTKDYALGMEYPLTVPEGKIFVLGDNRDHSADSRYADIGLVDERCILGRVMLIVWPFSEIGRVK